MAIKDIDRRPAGEATYNADETATLSAICNRVSRMLGLLDREALKQDIATVRASRPLNLEALAGAADDDFVREMLKIIDVADRENDALYAAFRSRLMSDTRLYIN